MMEEQRISCPLGAAAQVQPEALAVVSLEGALSYDELDGRVTAAARRLRERGCRQDARVALYGQRSADYLVLLAALLRVGAVACPLSTRTPPEMLPALLQRIGSRVLICVDEAAPDGAKSTAEVFDAEALVTAASPARSEKPPRLSLGQPATIVFTSGSTATPKAALHTVGNHYFSAAGSNQNIALRPGDRWLLSLPLYHVGGLAILFRCWLAGAAVVVPAPDEPLGTAMARHRVTHVSVVATQLRRLLRAGVPDVLNRLRAVLLGGGPIPPALVEEGLARELPLHTSYGLTEMASQVTTTSPGATPEQLRTAGQLLPHRRLRLAANGEVLVKGKTLFVGYVDRDGLHRPTDAEGWFHTGDLGALGPEGLLRIEGRADNLFISGGENVQPEEIEAALCRLPEVAEAVVVPVEDKEFGQRPVAFVRLIEGADPPADWAARLAPALPRFKSPVAFYGWPAQATRGMKVDRSFLREEARRRQGKAPRGRG